MKKWSVTLGLWCVLLLVGVQNVFANEPAYLKDMPTVSEIKNGIKGANEVQTLGRQCAAFGKLESSVFNFFPFGDDGQPVGRSVIAEYRNAVAQLDAKALGNKIGQAEWYRMCMNGRSGVHPSTGKPDSNYPALDQPVEINELTALFKPSVLAAYEQAKGQTPRSVFAPQGQQSHINRPVMDQVLGGFKQIENQMIAEQKDADAQYSKKIDTWLGSDINELIAKWGVPSGQSNPQNGGVLYEWLKSQSIFYAAHENESAFGYSYMIPSQTVTDWCKTQFLTNRAGKITETGWEGNACY